MGVSLKINSAYIYPENYDRYLGLLFNKLQTLKLLTPVIFCAANYLLCHTYRNIVVTTQQHTT